MRYPLEVIWEAFSGYCVLAVIVWTGRLSGGVPGISGRIHNLVEGSHFPCHNLCLLYNIKYFSLSYYDFQPASHNILMENK